MTERTRARTALNTSAIRFDAPIRKIGRWTILRLPDDASAKLPSRGQVAVDGVMNGHRFRTVLEPDGRRGHWLKVDKKLRQVLAVSEGDTVTVEVDPTKDWPEPGIPERFSDCSGRRGRHFRRCGRTSHRWRAGNGCAGYSATKNPETRKRRVEVGISKLRSGKRRPCCFDLAACTDPDLSKNGRLVDVV